MNNPGRDAEHPKNGGPHSPRHMVGKSKDYNKPIGVGRPSISQSETHFLTTTRSERSEFDKGHTTNRLLRKKSSGNMHSSTYFKWKRFMRSHTKNHIVAMIGEFIGTFLFLFFAFAGTQEALSANTGDATGFNFAAILYISLSFGFSLMVNAWVFFRISGGLFNPAVTLSLALLGAISPLRAVLLSITQIGSACFSSYIVSILYPTPFAVQTTLGAGTSVVQGVFIEGICTAELVFTIIMLAKEKHRATFIAPVGIGLALFIGELVAVFYTVGSLNPARSFGPAAVTRSFASDHWIYWVGPLGGSLVATGAYRLFKLLEYEMVNPGQDGDVENDPTQNPDHEIAQIVEERQAEVEEIIQAIKAESDYDPTLANSSSERAAWHDDGSPGFARARNHDDLEANWPCRQEVEAVERLEELSGQLRQDVQTVDKLERMSG